MDPKIKNNSSLTIEDLFKTCDTEGSGFIGPVQFSQLCSTFGIEAKDSRVIFLDLDYDGDGQINFQDFKFGFRDFLTPGSRRGSFQVLGIGETSNVSSGGGSGGANGSSVIQQLIEMEKKHACAKTAWRHLVDNVGERKLVDQLIGKQNKNCDKPTELERTLLSLVSDVQNLHDEYKNLENSFRKEREAHASQLAALGEELDSQLSKVRIEAQSQLEFERKKFGSELNSKLHQLNLQLQNFEKVESWLIKEEKEQENGHLHNNNNKTEFTLLETQSENNKLRSELFEAQLQARLLQSQLTQKKSEYMNLCKEFHFEKVASSEYRNQVDLMQNHLSLLSETNRVLSDANDCFLSSPYVQKEIIEDEVEIEEEDVVSLMSKTKKLSSSFCTSNGQDPESGLWTSSSTETETESLQTTPSQIRNMPLSTLPHRTFKIILAGDSGVGKTSFIERACHGHWVSHLSSTIGLDFKVKTMEVDGICVALQLWDTAGQERFHSLTKSYFRRADGVLLMYDVINEKSFLNIRHWITNIEEGASRQVPVVLCANKIDLRTASRPGSTVITYDQGLSLAQTYGALFIEVSPKSGFQITETLLLLTKEMSLMEDAELRKAATLHHLKESNEPIEIKKTNSCCSN